MQYSTTEREGAGNEPFAGHPLGGWRPDPVAAPAPRRAPGRVVPRTALIVAIAVAISLATVSVVAFNSERNVSHSLHTTQAVLATSNSELAQTRSTLASTKAQLAHTSAALARQDAQVASLRAQVAHLQRELSASQSSLHASQQVGVQVATVAGSLKRCVDNTQTFEAGFNLELSSGFFSDIVTNEATQADASCAQANADYNTLESDLNFDTARAT